jgi:hypothetical protein
MKDHFDDWIAKLSPEDQKQLSEAIKAVGSWSSPMFVPAPPKQSQEIVIEIDNVIAKRVIVFLLEQGWTIKPPPK